MPTSARPLETARLTAFWPGKLSTVTDFLPSLVHFLLWASASSCSTVPFSAATVLPQRSERGVHADHRVTVGGDELVRGVLGFGGDVQRAFCVDRRGNRRDDRGARGIG